MLAAFLTSDRTSRCREVSLCPQVARLYSALGRFSVLPVSFALVSRDLVLITSWFNRFKHSCVEQIQRACCVPRAHGVGISSVNGCSVSNGGSSSVAQRPRVR